MRNGPGALPRVGLGPGVARPGGGPRFWPSLVPGSRASASRPGLPRPASRRVIGAAAGAGAQVG